jgi:adenylate cyclase
VGTCAEDGTPNITALSQAQYVDPEHVALSYQFFNKTRANVLANPLVTLLTVHPLTAAQYRFRLRYLRTETEGPLFESMKAKLSGIASHTGMGGVFRLLGADVYRVLGLEQVPGPSLAPPPRPNLFTALRAAFARMGAACDLEALFAGTLECLDTCFGMRHSMILLLDCHGERLYTVASRGYPASGAGSEIPLGQGVIGVCARVRTPIRIGRMTAEYTYGKAIAAQAEAHGLGALLEEQIPLPGLPESSSQLAVPIAGQRRLLGVLYLESPFDLRFSYDDEDAMVLLAAQLGLAMERIQASIEAAPDESQAGAGALAEPEPEPAAEPVVVRYYPENDSVFLGGDYLIKGVAGSILWTLLKDHAEKGQRLFSNRELRLDPRIRLPDLSDNLEARLILLGRRLVDKGACVRMERVGRGRFRLHVDRSLTLVEV